ncbi:uncharacterized protein [Drosophila pseudoobscura]|uniref:Uncharacterized protein isoform X1 n=2 Tax=Drosophila pseudoobscura pseudoobscura TaxID=46245 RepID=A0A6I8V7P8_DROPS|nr:uncharacterized protein LOC26534377 isoform X1 [Drosophila pseudoobscura]
MSNSGFIGLIKKNYHSLMNIFSTSGSSSDSDAGSSPRRLNAFNVTISRRAKFHTLLSQKDTVTKLINLYRQNECLWNPSCPDYKSAEYQEKVWKDIASAIDTNMPVVPVKRKVHVLRDQWEAAGRKELPMPKLFDYPDFGFLTHAVAETAASAVEQLTNIQVVELDRIDSGSEAMQADHTDFAESSNRNTSNTEQTVALLPSEYIISNKGQHIANLCEVIRIDLEQIHDEFFFEAKWKILDVLRDAQLKQLQRLQEGQKAKLDDADSTTI